MHCNVIVLPAGCTVMLLRERSTADVVVHNSGHGPGRNTQGLLSRPNLTRCDARHHQEPVVCRHRQYRFSRAVTHQCNVCRDKGEHIPSPLVVGAPCLLAQSPRRADEERGQEKEEHCERGMVEGRREAAAARALLCGRTHAACEPWGWCWTSMRRGDVGEGTERQTCTQRPRPMGQLASYSVCCGGD